MIFTKMFNVGVASEWVIGFSGVDRLTKSTLEKGANLNPKLYLHWRLLLIFCWGP